MHKTKGDEFSDATGILLHVPQERDVPGVRVLRVANPFGLRNIPIGPSIWKAFFDLLLFFKGFGLARKNRYALIHAVEDAGPVAVVLSRLFRSRLVFEKHSDPGSYRRGALRNLVMYLYGKVEAFSRPGGGTTLRLTLPLAPDNRTST